MDGYQTMVINNAFIILIWTSFVAVNIEWTGKNFIQLSLCAFNSIYICVQGENNRYQRVVLNGKFSSWFYINSGVSQNSILGPLFFQININDLLNSVTSATKQFPGDT